MRHDFKLERRAILFGVLALVAADVALVVYSWNLSSGARVQQELTVETRNRDLLRADIARAQDIRQKMPAIQRDCDQFEQSLFPVTTGYSSVSSELSGIANKAGLQLEGSSFQQHEVKGRELAEVEIVATVNGSYGSVVRFLNGLQRSSNVYAVEALEAKSETSQQGNKGDVRVSMHIKTYFRTV
jgi:Tfp pilus assembly protein PilO